MTTPPTSLWLSRTGDRTGRNDRLVPRFVTGGELFTHVRLGRSDPDPSRVVVAEVSDISVTGMLLRVTDCLRIPAGVTLTLGDAPSTATVRVVHSRREVDGRTQWLGVEIAESTPEFHDELLQAVAALRKDRGQIREFWERGG